MDVNDFNIYSTLLEQQCADVKAVKKKTRRMAIANGPCVSFCNQTKAHFGLP